MLRGEGPEPSRLEKVRARIHQRIDEIHDVEDLEFVELAASLSEMPFDGDVSLETLLSVSDYVGSARARYELEVEKLKRARSSKEAAS